ncbi:hypothetical protein HMPREF3170_03645 [Corynebacterium sp. HMSC08D02]|nr:hypothetical protein HMPREF3170_03645 [Corynebacterium sp. HMSC08D02]
MVTQIEIQGQQVPLLVEIVMARLQEVTQRCSELERALSDVPRSPFIEAKHLEELKAKLEESQGQYAAARDDRAQLLEELKRADHERKQALESARVLREKNQSLLAETEGLRKQLLEERETATAQERAEEARQACEEADRQRAHAKGEATKAKRLLVAARSHIKELEAQLARSSATSWDSVERHLAAAVKAFEDDPDKSFTALMRAKHALETRPDDE